MHFAMLSRERSAHDWYHVSNIGEAFCGRVVLAIDYAAYEAAMTSVVMEAARLNRASEFILMLAVEGGQEKKGSIGALELPRVVVGMLRDELGFDVRVEAEHFFVHPAHDDTLYIGSEAPTDLLEQFAIAQYISLRTGVVSPWLEQHGFDHGPETLMPWPRSFPER